MHSFIYRIIFLILAYGISAHTYAQEKRNLSYGAEFLIGFTTPSNEFFPNRKLQKQVVFKIGGDSKSADHFLRLQSGITVGFTNFGNTKELGYAISILPYLQLPILESNRLYFQTALGASYFNKKYSFENNFDNRAVSTRLTWSFRGFLIYELLESDFAKYTLNTGIVHHSNGHLKLPNNGYNSVLLGLGIQTKSHNSTSDNKDRAIPSDFDRKYYGQLRWGVGQNVFNDQAPFNTRKEVYTISSELGINLKKRVKVGVGAIYRWYEHYYDYISNNESLVQKGREFSNLKSNAHWNASAVILYTKGEILLHHIGLEFLVGVNLHKPAYAIDWRINEGWDYVPRDIPEPPAWQLGEYDTKYQLKKLINGRLGVKYYLKDLQENHTSNLFVGIFLNTNLGQADFTEVGLGYLKNL